MRNPFSSASLENFKKSSSEAVRRFPVATLALAFAACLAFLGVHEAIPDGYEDVAVRLCASSAVAYFASVAIRLFCEGASIPKNRALAGQAWAVVAAGAFFWTFDTEGGFKNALIVALTFAVLVGFTFFAPYLKSPFAKKPGQDAYYAYFRRIAAVFVSSAILWGALSALGNIAIFATGTLFDIPNTVTGKMVGDWMVLALVLSTPFFALASVPAKPTFDVAKYDETAFFSFLVKYVAIPFVTIYFLILYAYTAKVLANFSEWPKGEVTWMVIGFSFFGYLAYAFSYGLEKEFAFVKKFRKALPFAVMPQIAMLAYAIWLRIAQYDLTANRYFVVVFGIMLLVLSAYFAFSKDKRLVAIPVAVVGFAVAISVGPWSVFSLPAARQEARLVRNLELAGMMANGKVSAPTTPLSKEFSVEIYEGADYLADYDGTRALKDLFPEQYAKADKEARAEFDKNDGVLPTSSRSRNAKREYRWPDRYRLFEILKDDLGIKSKYSWGGLDEESVMTYRQMSSTVPVKIAGYSEMRVLDISSYSKDAIGTEYDLDTHRFTFYKSLGVKETVDLSPFVQELVKKHAWSSQTTVPSADLIFETWDYKFVFKNFPVLNSKSANQSGEKRYWSLDGYLFIK